MLTVPADYAVHSMHCYFVLAGDSEIPILYHVERVRDGRSFVTRTVQARQRGRPIFTTTLSFSRVGSGGEKTIHHAVSKPDVPLPEEAEPGSLKALSNAGGGPFESRKAGILNRTSLVGSSIAMHVVLMAVGIKQAHPLTKKIRRSDDTFAPAAQSPNRVVTKRTCRHLPISPTAISSVPSRSSTISRDFPPRPNSRNF